MKATKIADKIIKSMYREFLSTGNDSSSINTMIQKFPDVPEHILCMAVKMLGIDGLLSVRYADNKPDQFVLNVLAIQQCDENTILKKGYKFIKEIRSWL